MRLKEDKSSWKSHGVVAKDTRNAKDELKEKPKGKKKNTKNWCKGKEGVPHIASEWLKENMYSTLYRCVVRCIKCNKILNCRFRSIPR